VTRGDFDAAVEISNRKRRLTSAEEIQNDEAIAEDTVKTVASESWCRHAPWWGNARSLAT
jgi:hypothetical protein